MSFFRFSQPQLCERVTNLTNCRGNGSPALHLIQLEQSQNQPGQEAQISQGSIPDPPGWTQRAQKRCGHKADEEFNTGRTQNVQGSSHNSPVKLIRSTLRAEPSWLLWLPTEPHPACHPPSPASSHWVSCTHWEGKVQLCCLMEG